MKNGAMPEISALLMRLPHRYPRLYRTVKHGARWPALSITLSEPFRLLSCQLRVVGSGCRIDFRLHWFAFDGVGEPPDTAGIQAIQNLRRHLRDPAAEVPHSLSATSGRSKSGRPKIARPLGCFSDSQHIGHGWCWVRC